MEDTKQRQQVAVGVALLLVEMGGLAAAVMEQLEDQATPECGLNSRPKWQLGPWSRKHRQRVRTRKQSRCSAR